MPGKACGCLLSPCASVFSDSLQLRFRRETVILMPILQQSPFVTCACCDLPADKCVDTKSLTLSHGTSALRSFGGSELRVTSCPDNAQIEMDICRGSSSSRHDFSAWDIELDSCGGVCSRTHRETVSRAVAEPAFAESDERELVNTRGCNPDNAAESVRKFLVKDRPVFAGAV
jgi:hypothetical protein